MNESRRIMATFSWERGCPPPKGGGGCACVDNPGIAFLPENMNEDL